MGVLAATSMPSTVATPDGRLIWVNEALCSMLGRSEAELLTLSWPDVCHPDDVPTLAEHVAASAAGGPASWRMRMRVVRGDGEIRWGDLTATMIRDAEGAVQWMLGQAMDITDQMSTEQALEVSEHRYRLLAENVGDVVGTGTMDGRITWVSDSIRDLLGWSPDELVGRRMIELVHPEEQDSLRDAQRQLRLGITMSYDARLRTSGGGWRWVRARVRPTLDMAGAPNGVIASWQDINDRVEATHRLDTVLGTDWLTGLPNRATIAERIRNTQLQHRGAECEAALLCIGVDRLGDVNSAINHAAGDHVLAVVARRIAEVVPDTQLLGRGAGVDFLVLLPSLNSTSDAVAIAERIRSEVRKEIVVDHHRVRVTASIGIATCHVTSSPEDLIGSATLAMQAAKDQGRDRLVFDDPSLREEAERLLSLAEHARDGIIANRFLPWFMPIVDLGSRRTVGFEALMRWDFPGGVLEPKDFMTALIEARLIGEVDRMILRQSLARLAVLPDAQFMSVNVSPQALSVPGFSEDVIALVRDLELEPARLHLELTETSLFRASSSIMREMHVLADAGVKWYVDDFGMGYSSLSHLHDLPIAGLKLDSSFTAGVAAGNPRSLRIAQALAGLAGGLVLDGIAEGVESEAQAVLLDEQGWHRGQGLLFGAAEPVT